MKCPACGRGMGLRKLLRTSPGRPFPCASCGKPLRIAPSKALATAAAAFLACLLPLTGILPGGFELFWILAVLGGAFYAYLSLARPYDPTEVLSFKASGGTFELLPEAVRWKGEVHSYAAVVHLARYAKRTSINFIPLVDFLRLRVWFGGIAKPVTLQNGFGLAFTTAGLQEIYERLAEKTFHARIRAYVLQLNKAGFFEYGGAKFHRGGEVTIGNAKLDLRTAKLSLEPFKLVLNPPGMFNRKRSIDTEVDVDVLLTLLQKVYGITFKD